MDGQTFIDTLRQKLTEAGFPLAYVERQCDTLTENLKALPQNTEAQYITMRNIDIIVRKLTAQDGHLIESTPLAETETVEETPSSADEPTQETVTEEIATDDASVEAVEVTESVESIKAAQPADSAESADEPSTESPEEPSAESETDAPAPIAPPAMKKRAVPVAEYTPCDKPLLLTFLLALICAPTILLFLTTAFGLFASVFLVLAASIFVIVLAIIGIVGVGSVVSLASLLYGATQILSSPRYVGFHEIGFGLIIAGLTMGSSILLYNLAIRWIPFISEQMGKLFKLFFRKLISFAKNAVKGCEQL